MIIKPNPKSQYLNSKQFLNPNFLIFQTFKFGIWNLEHWDLFRISNLGFRIFRCLVCVLGIWFLVFNYAFAQPISSVELINNAKQYDGKTITYEGEVIGDIMLRGEYAWINVNDGQAAIGIWIDKDKTLDILYTGSYKSKGDWVEITGVFQRVCPQHGGDLDIHAQALRKIRPGRLAIEQLNIRKRNFVLVLLGALCLILILRRLRLT